MLEVKIQVRGRIDRQWSDWFADMQITPAGQDQTVLSGTVVDQAALYGLLARLRDLGLALVSVQSTEAGGEANRRP
jgi:hypothetical protein